VESVTTIAGFRRSGRVFELPGSGASPARVKVLHTTRGEGTPARHVIDGKLTCLRDGAVRISNCSAPAPNPCLRGVPARHAAWRRYATDLRNIKYARYKLPDQYDGAPFVGWQVAQRRIGPGVLTAA